MLEELKLTTDNKVQIFASFLGSFFAFCFFIIGDKISLSYKRRIACRNEHVYLERYFDHLRLPLEINANFLSATITNLKSNGLDTTRFQRLPIRYEAEMTLLDLDFLNKYHAFVLDIAKFNESIVDANLIKERINVYTEKYIIEEASQKQKKFTENSRENLSLELISFRKFIFMLQDDLLDIYPENRFLLDYYKSFFIKRIFLCLIIRFYKNYKIDKIKKYRVEYEQELKSTYQDGIQKYKKYNML